MKSRIMLYLFGVQKVDGGGRKTSRKLRPKVNSSKLGCFDVVSSPNFTKDLGELNGSL